MANAKLWKCKLGGVTEGRIVGKYVIRNALLPQITGLALSLGQIFSGALITEIVFGYPGLCAHQKPAFRPKVNERATGYA